MLLQRFMCVKKGSVENSNRRLSIMKNWWRLIFHIIESWLSGIGQLFEFQTGGSYLFYGSCYRWVLLKSSISRRNSFSEIFSFQCLSITFSILEWYYYCNLISSNSKIAKYISEMRSLMWVLIQIERRFLWYI